MHTFLIVLVVLYGVTLVTCAALVLDHMLVASWRRWQRDRRFRQIVSAYDQEFSR